MIKLNAKFGVAAIVAALFVAFGAFGLSTTTTSASPAPPFVIGQGPCTPDGGTPGAAIPAAGVASGTTLCVRIEFTNTLAPLRVTYRTTNAVGGNMTLVKAQEFTSVTPAVLDITGIAADDCPNVGCPADIAGWPVTGNNTYYQNSGTLGQYPVQPPPLQSLRYDLTVVVTCADQNAVSGTIQFLAFQNSAPFTNTVTSSTVTCITPKSSVLSIKKIDQNGGLRGATFAVQQEVPFGSGNWITIATMVASGTNPANNPCLSSSASCTLNPSTNNAGTLPPTITTTPPAIPSGVPIRIIEVAQPANCTLVEILDGNSPPAKLVQPVLISDISTATLAARTLTFTNSCAIAGSPNAAGSSIAVVYGGATFGLSNTTHIEIIPALGSDDDARLDIRARDSLNVPLVGAHVTVMIDKGALAMRTETSGVAPSGYEVIEPSSPNFGSIYNGDTCDQSILQNNILTGSNIYSGNNTNPFLTSRLVQDSFTNADGILSACVYVNPDFALGITPGKITVTAIIEQPGIGLYSPYGSQNLILTATITVVGPPASIKVAASPTSVQCGEKSTITATVTDSVGQNVSDHTRVELVSNFGATIGGTGATLGFPGVGAVNPLSSSAAETFSGVATAFLLTSTEHVGPYEVVVASGGSVGGVRAVNDLSYQAGAFSTAPVSAQVTVTCALPVVAVPAPVVTAPIRAPITGEGIRPPNTGDAGLAAGSDSSLLFVLGGVVAFAVAGLASVKFARR